MSGHPPPGPYDRWPIEPKDDLGWVGALFLLGLAVLLGLSLGEFFARPVIIFPVQQPMALMPEPARLRRKQDGTGAL